MEKFSVASVFTTSSEEYFNQHGKQLAESLFKKTGNRLVVYSEDNLDAFNHIIEPKKLRYFHELSQFQNEFKTHYASKYQFLPYLMKMDVWAFKIAAQLQHLEENPGESTLYLDSDSVVLSKKFVTDVNHFFNITRDFDCGLFRRENNFLHPETGFIVLNNSPRLLSAYLTMFENIIHWRFKDLPSWTDSSLLDEQIEKKFISHVDYCRVLGLRSTNPVYESILRRSFIHLKGSRKGSFSRLKLILGGYR